MDRKELTRKIEALEDRYAPGTGPGEMDALSIALQETFDELATADDEEIDNYLNMLAEDGIILDRKAVRDTAWNLCSTSARWKMIKAGYVPVSH